MTEFDKDVQKAMQDMDELDRNIRRALPDAAQAGGHILLEQAEANAPSLSGQLKGSGDDEAQERTLNSASHRVFFKAFYAKFQEFGTRHHSAQVFLQSAARQKRRQIQREINKRIDRAVRKATK